MFKYGPSIQKQNVLISDDTSKWQNIMNSSGFKVLLYTKYPGLNQDKEYMTHPVRWTNINNSLHIIMQKINNLLEGIMVL